MKQIIFFFWGGGGRGQANPPEPPLDPPLHVPFSRDSHLKTEKYFSEFRKKFIFLVKNRPDDKTSFITLFVS